MASTTGPRSSARVPDQSRIRLFSIALENMMQSDRQERADTLGEDYFAARDFAENKVDIQTDFEKSDGRA